MKVSLDVLSRVYKTGGTGLMCLLQSSSNWKRPEAEIAEINIPSVASVSDCVQHPEQNLLEVLQQPLLPGCAQLPAHPHSSRVMGLTFPLALCRESPSHVTRMSATVLTLADSPLRRSSPPLDFPEIMFQSYFQFSYA